MSEFTTNKCVPVQTVGGGGGHSFDSVRADGSLVSRIEAWADDNRMRGIKVYYSHSRDGYTVGDQGEMFGKPGGRYFEFTFQTGETIASLSIWNTKWHDHTYVGAFKFTTSLGRTFYPKEKSSSHTEFPIDTGYGAAVGITGRCGDALDKLGFYLIRDAKKLAITDVVFDTTNLPEPREIDLNTGTYVNGTSVEQTEETAYSYEDSQTSEWSMTSGFQDSYSITITAEVPIVEAVVVGGEASASWEYSQSTTNSTSFTETHQESQTFPIAIPPYTQVDYSMAYFRGACDVAYSGLVTLTLDNNETFTYYATGTYAGANTTDVTATLTQTPIDTDGQPSGSGGTVSMVIAQPS